MNRFSRVCFSTLLVAAIIASSAGQAQQRKAPSKPATEDDYYKLLTFKTPPGEVLEAGKLFENFRYKFEFPAGAQPGAELPLIGQDKLAAARTASLHTANRSNLAYGYVARRV